MRTSKPIGTISYNSQEFLLAKLNELVKNHKVCDWIFINHFAESDETKNHIHLWIKPNTLIDTMDLQNHFMEYVPSSPTKPLKCIDFRPSAIDDWLLYSMHLKAYLASKGESREYAYTKDDFVYNDDDSFNDLFNHAMRGSEWAKRNQTLNLLNDGTISPVSLISSGMIPLNMASQVNSFIYLKTHYGLDRGNHQGHE